MAYEPALDGLRAVAVIGVLLFHAEFSWASGGFLGVSTFFTLSGYLITTLLLRERQRSGQTNLAGFWSRRFRRLMPAALLTLLVVDLYGAVLAGPSQLANLRGDVIAALAYVANWRFILDSNSYADLFAAPSPVLHFWSLAIEEQFYLLFPLITVAAFMLAKGRLSRTGLVFGALFAASVGMTLLLAVTGASNDRIYYGTDTRIAELLAGALLAVLLSSPNGSRIRTRWAPVAGPAALTVMLLIWITTDLATPWLYRGGLPVYGLLSAVVVTAAVAHTGPVHSVLSVKPLAWLGLISYGVYLFHWPIYLWLTTDRTGLSQAPLFALRFTVTVAAATASYFLVEQPVRLRRVLTDNRRAILTATAVASVTIIWLAAITATLPAAPIDFEQANADAAALATGAGNTDAHCADGSPVPASTGVAPRIGAVGDSTGLLAAVGLGVWALCNGRASPAGSSHALACGVGRGGARVFAGREVAMLETCEVWRDEFGPEFSATRPDMIVVLFGPADLTDRYLEGDDQWRHIGDPVYDDYLRSEMDSFVELLLSLAPQAVWLLGPPMRPLVDGQPPDPPFAESDPDRLEAYNAMISSLPRSHPGLSIIDLNPWFDALPDGPFDATARPDGVHLSDEAAVRLAEEYLGPQLLARYQPPTN